MYEFLGLISVGYADGRVVRLLARKGDLMETALTWAHEHRDIDCE